MARLFLSYSREDLRIVERLAEALKQRGHSVWWDRDIRGGTAFSAAIEQALDDAEAVVVCWSRASIASDWVRDEAATGRDSGRLVPLTLDASRPPLGFRQYQTIDLARWDGDARSALLHPLEVALSQQPQGATPTAVTAPPPALTSRPPVRRRIIAASAAGLVLALAAAFVLVPRRGSAEGGIEPKVAVGQFALSPGVPADLSSSLGHETVAAFGAENAVAVIAPGDRNGASAQFVMEGSAARLGDEIKISVNLKDQRSGVVLWSGDFSHEVADASAARQAAVAASQVVRCGLWGASAYPRPMPDRALSLYLQWCNEHWSGSSRENAELDAAKRVTVALPDFSFGWSALALATIPLAAASSSEAPRLRAEGIAAARKSMALDDLNPEGYMALAGLAPERQFGEREKLLVQALGVRPTECGCERQAYGDFLAAVGRMTEAAEQYERARDMRPLAPFSNLRLAQALFMIGRSEEAQKLLDQSIALWPDATSLQLLKLKSALWTGQYDSALAVLDNPDLPLTSDQRAAMARAMSALRSGSAAGEAEAARALQDLAANPRFNDKLVVAMLAALGAHAAAVERAAALIRDRGLWQSEILFEPRLLEADSTPEYQQLVQSLGLAAFWKQSGKFPDLCRTREPPPFCR